MSRLSRDCGALEFDLRHCPDRGYAPKIIAAILDLPVIEKILTHLGLQARGRPQVHAWGTQLQAA